MPKTRGWTRRELLLALGLYLQTDFGRLHRSNPEVVALAAAIGRTPSAVAMKACNFASLDPALQQSGLSSTSRADRQIWEEFQADSESLANEIGILADEVNLPLSPALSAPTPTSPVAGERAGVRGKPDTARDAHSASVIPAEAGLHRPPAAGLPQSRHHAPRDEPPLLDVLSTTTPRSSQIAPPAGLVPRSVTATLPAGPTDAQALVRTRRVQSFFRRAVLISYNGRCALTGLPVQSLLNASHIIPWSVSTPRRADPTNGLCLPK